MNDKKGRLIEGDFTRGPQSTLEERAARLERRKTANATENSSEVANLQRNFETKFIAELSEIIKLLDLLVLDNQKILFRLRLDDFLNKRRLWEQKFDQILPPLLPMIHSVPYARELDIHAISTLESYLEKLKTLDIKKLRAEENPTQQLEILRDFAEQFDDIGLRETKGGMG